MRGSGFKGSQTQKIGEKKWLRKTLDVNLWLEHMYAHVHTHTYTNYTHINYTHTYTPMYQMNAHVCTYACIHIASTRALHLARQESSKLFTRTW